MDKRILAVLAIVLLFVVLAIAYWNGLFLVDSRGEAERVLCDTFVNAVNSPNNILVSGNLVLLKDAAYSTAFFAECGGIEKECISIQAPDLDAFRVNENKVIEMNALLQAIVQYNCMPGNQFGKEGCPLFCTITFEKVK